MSGFPISFLSSLKEDVWHDQKGLNAFESWHFDALSDDGRQALVVRFHDNCPFSPRYFHPAKGANGPLGNTRIRIPSVSMVFTIDGKTVAGAVNEFKPDQFSTGQSGINVSIGNSWFRVKDAEYGSGFVIGIDLLTARKRRIIAELEWLSIEAGLFDVPKQNYEGSESWNIVAPRSDVSGRITIFGSSGLTKNIYHFRGTGYHDHYTSDLLDEDKSRMRYSGRGHFVDLTAVFLELTDNIGENLSKLFLVKDGVMEELESQAEYRTNVHNRYGLRVPYEVRFTSRDNVSLSVKPISSIEAGFCDSKLLNRMTLTLPDRSTRETIGISTYLAPGRLKSRFIRQLSDLRIGKDGRSPLF